MKNKPLFITFEGIEASGKSTALKSLKELLPSDKFVFTREPGGTNLKVCEDIRNIILDNGNVNISHETEALLYAASREQHIHELVEPSLESGKNVICDRYIDSTFVYQGDARGIDKTWLEQINSKLRPDITFLLDLKIEDMQKRLVNRNEKTSDRMDNENIEFHKKTYEGFQKLAKQEPNRFYIIDALKTPKEIVDEIMKVISEKAKW